MAHLARLTALEGQNFLEFSGPLRFTYVGFGQSLRGGRLDGFGSGAISTAEM
jgi:hypothetical protein